MKRKLKRKWSKISTNHKLIFLGILGILLLTVGYSVMTGMLNINGYASIDRGDGMIFTQIDMKENTNAQIESTPGIKAKTMISTKIAFDKVGSITFMVSAQNQGEYDAKLIEIGKLDHVNEQAPQCIQVEVVDHNIGETIYAGSLKTFEISVTSTCTQYSEKEIELYFKYQQQETQGGELPDLPSSNNLVEHLIENKVENTVPNGGNGLVKLDSKGLITTSTTPREYRYIGANPDNYLSFGTSTNNVYAYSFEQDLGNGNMKVTFSTLEECEMEAHYSSGIVQECYEERILKVGDSLDFRIIGIFDGKLKIIAKDSIGNFGWNRFDNNWQNADLQYFLNDLYLKNIDQGSDVVLEQVWTLGGSRTFNDVTSQMYYDRERGTDVYSGNATTWTGKIGLMYPSDYGFATSGGSSMNRNSCLSTAIYSWEKTNAINCRDNDWLLDKTDIQWTMTSSVTYNNFLCHIGRSGWVSYAGGTSSLSYAIRPTMYLNADVEFLSGTGTEGDPYILKLS